MKRNLLAFAAIGLLAAAVSGCANLTGKDEASVEFDKETSADDARVMETQTRTGLSALEAAVSDYVKTEQKVPDHLELLIPKYLAQIPSLNVPACGGESNMHPELSALDPARRAGGRLGACAARGVGATCTTKRASSSSSIA